MSTSAILWQVDPGSAAAWKEPPGEPKEFDEELLDENGKLQLDGDWVDIEAVLEQLGLKAPWANEDDRGDPAAVQRLATRLVPLSWEGAIARGLEVAALPHGMDAEVIAEAWERFRMFVIDAARAANGLEWEID